jgi:hemolysin activation/secretion protein
VAETNFGANWGNVFGTGQIFSYQLTRSLTGRSISHSVSDTIPLPWGDQLLIFGSYGEQQPLMAQIFNDQGHSGQASVRYVRPLPRIRRFTEDLQIGYDFKTTDNNLEFAGFQVFGTQAEVDQFPLVYDASQTDHLGQTAIQNIFVFSPGRLTANNTTAALSTLVPGARADYLYDRVLVTRTTPLPKSFSAITRVTLQASSSNLPYSEQVGGGGVGSVRGYYTDTAFGSRGEMFSQELRLPAFGPSQAFDRDSQLGGKAQLGVFFDYADLRQVSPIPDVQSPVELASAGFLARYSISRFLDVQYDMGYRLRGPPTVPERGAYGQVSLTGSF